MPAQLWLLRHAEAVPHGSKPDADRELTARGERQAEAAGAALARLGLEFDACYTSPKIRARDTARLTCAALGVEPVEVAALTEGFDRSDAWEMLLAHDADAHVLMVGHNPDFEQVVYDLTGGRVDIKKGGIVAVRMARADSQLLVVLRPREIESLAGTPASA